MELGQEGSSYIVGIFNALRLREPDASISIIGLAVSRGQVVLKSASSGQYCIRPSCSHYITLFPLVTTPFLSDLFSKLVIIFSEVLFWSKNHIPLFREFFYVLFLIHSIISYFQILRECRFS